MSRVLCGHKEPSLEQGDGQRRLWVGISQAEFRMNMVGCLEGTGNKNFLLWSIAELSGGQWWSWPRHTGQPVQMVLAASSSVSFPRASASVPKRVTVSASSLAPLLLS